MGIEQLPSGHWRAVPWDKHAKRKLTKLGQTFDTWSEADDYRTEVQERVAAGHAVGVDAARRIAEGLGLPAASDPGDAVTFRAAAQQWLEGRDVEPATLRHNRMALKHAIAWFGTMSITAIRRHDVERFRARLSTDGLSWNYRRHILVDVSAVFDWAVDNELRPSNPARGMKVKRGHTRPGRILTVAEVDAIRREMPTWLEPAVLLGYYQGLRASEMLGLRAFRVDLRPSANGCGRIEIADVRTERGTYRPYTKNGKTAVLPLRPRVRQQLSAHFEVFGCTGNDLVFRNPATGRGPCYYTLRKAFLEACARAGLNDVHLHDLRHSFGTGLGAAEAPSTAIKDGMRHSDLSTADVYVAPRELEALERWFLRADQGDAA